MDIEVNMCGSPECDQLFVMFAEFFPGTRCCVILCHLMCIFVEILAYEVAIPAPDVKHNFIFRVSSVFIPRHS